jgi:hypothetical protein
MTQFNVDLLLGRRVLSRDGRPLGHVEAIHVVEEGDAWVISEYHIGPDALLERLAVGLLPRLLHKVMARGRPAWRRRIAWHQIDVADPRHPRLLCDETELDNVS